MRPWLVKDPNWTPGYVPEADESMAAPMTRDALGRLLDSAAASGDSAFIGICFDINDHRHDA
jgi:hypothetical protein